MDEKADEIRNKLGELLDEIQDSGCSGEIEVHGRNYPDTISNEKVADHLISHGVTVQRWIPVSERLPKESGFWFDDMKEALLIYTPVDGCMHIGWYIGKDWRGRDTWNVLTVMRSVQTCKKKVTHWMPLPEPPGKDVGA